MVWKVQSSISGGTKLSVSQESEYRSCCNQLHKLSQEFDSLSSQWMQAASRIMANSLAKNSCEGPLCNTNNSLTTSLTYDQCEMNSKECKRFSEKLFELSVLLSRANSLYSEAERASKQLFDNVVSLGFTFAPATAIPIFVYAGISIFKDSTTPNSNMRNFAKWSHDTAPLQQGLIKGLSQHFIINPITGLPLRWLNSIQKTKSLFKNAKFSFGFSNFNSPLARVSGGLSSISSRINNLWQGNKLTVTKVNIPKKSYKNILPKKGQTIGEAFTNITELSNGNIGVKPPLVNSEAATVAIQCFRKPDGSKSWLVTIPGTDGKPHSPFGWEQNAEVMSENKISRTQADSTRMVIEAMRKAGINKNDSVAIIGHSQGGIVAASIASDYSEEYNIQHVITAGSPIANHPIPKKTWVTSVEMDDELVPSLDGKSNPSRNNWVTISAKTTHYGNEKNKDDKRNKKSKSSKDSYNVSGTTVKGVPESGTLTHDLHYHCAAYEDASALGSRAIRSQEEHFENIVSGKLESTTLWQGTVNK